MKKVIRLTENDLHRIVKNSVKRILKEGKTVNNKPYFRDKPSSPYYKKGERISWGDDKETLDALAQELPDKANVFQGAYKHNQRTYNNDYTDELSPEKHAERYQFMKMLKYNGITREQFENMDGDEQYDCWDYYEKMLRHYDNDGHEEDRYWNTQW